MKSSAMIVFAFALGILFCECAMPYPLNHGPFEDGKKPVAFLLHECEKLERQNLDSDKGLQIETYSAKGAKSDAPQIRIVRSYVDGVSISILTSDGDVIAGPEQIGPMWHGGHVFWADLNGDDREDFIAETWYGGCGLASGYSNLAFALSSKEGYKITVVQMMYPELVDFVDLFNDGRCQIIHTSFVYGEHGRDGKRHNYWVYNLIEISGTEMRVANELDAQFPKWVWFTFKPNHKATTQLKEEQKMRLWKPMADSVFWKPEGESEE